MDVCAKKILCVNRNFTNESYINLWVYDILIYGCKNKSLGVSLIRCPFIRKIVEGSPMELMVYLDTGSWSDNGTQYMFILIRQALYTNRKLMVTTMISMPLSHQ